MPQEIRLPKLTEEEAARRIINWLKGPRTQFYSSVSSPNFGHELYIPDVIINCYQEVIEEDKRRHPVDGMRQYSMNLDSPETAVLYNAAWILCQAGLLRPNPPNPHANGVDINKGFTVTSKGKKWLSQIRGDESTLAKLLHSPSGTIEAELESNEVTEHSSIPTLRKDKDRGRPPATANPSLIKYLSDMVNRPLKNYLSEPQNVWLEAIYAKFKKGEPPSARALSVELRDKLPKDFDPEKINTHLLRSGIDITILGIALLDPDSDLVHRTDRIIRDIQERLFNNPDIKSISAAEISQTTEIQEYDVAVILEMLSFTSLFHGSGTRYGPKGWATFNIEDRAFKQYFKELV